MNLNNIYYFASKNNLSNDFDDAGSELEDVMSENGESIEDLDGDENNTFYVDFIYDGFEANVNDFEKRFNDYLVENEVRKQVG